MKDENLIARVYPAPGFDPNKCAETAIKASPYYVAPSSQDPDKESRYGRGDDDVSVPAQDGADGE